MSETPTDLYVAADAWGGLTVRRRHPSRPDSPTSLLSDYEIDDALWQYLIRDLPTAPPIDSGSADQRRDQCVEPATTSSP